MTQTVLGRVVRVRSAAPVVVDSDSSESDQDEEPPVPDLHVRSSCCAHTLCSASAPSAATGVATDPAASTCPPVPTADVDVDVAYAQRSGPTEPLLAGTARSPTGRDSAWHSKRLRMVIGCTRSEAIGTLVPYIYPGY